MTRSFAKALLLFLTLFGCDPHLRAADLTLRLQDPPAAGTLIVLLFDAANAFGDLRDPAARFETALDGRDVYRFEGVPSGEYALLAYLDENANGRIDRNFIGIPREPLGFSNGYRPKGPPSYARAAFFLAEDETREFTIGLARPLGRLGRVGIGGACLLRGSPYRGSNRLVYRLIPAVTYTGERLQIYGPYVQCGLFGSDRARMAATGRYRLGPYEEDDSPALDGLGDRKDTLMAGLAVQLEPGGGLDLSVSYEHDVLGRVEGGRAQIAVDKTFQLGRVRLSPELALDWLSADLAGHDYGVPPTAATPARPAWDVGAAVNTETGLRAFVDISRDWLLAAGVAVEWLDNNITRSPIVEDDHVVKGFATLSYVL